MGFLDILSPAIGGVSAIAGLLGADSARRQAYQQQQQAILDLKLSNDRQYQNELNAGQHTLFDQAGRGADAILGLGRSLGADAAAGGVYNSSAVSSALASAQRDQDAALADLAAKNYYNANALYNDQQRQVANLQFGFGAQNLGNARADLGSSLAGLGSALGSIAQNNLSRSGANAPRTALPQVNGTVGQGANLPGNAGLDALGGVAAAGYGLPAPSVLDTRAPAIPTFAHPGVAFPGAGSFAYGADPILGYRSPFALRPPADTYGVLAGR